MPTFFRFMFVMSVKVFLAEKVQVKIFTYIYMNDGVVRCFVVIILSVLVDLRDIFANGL